MRGGLAAGLMFVIVGHADVSAQGTNDAHMIRRPRGDIMDVRQGVGNDAAAERTVKVGDRLGSDLYAARHVVAAPAGSASARDGTRWIRHGRASLLVDVRDGRVLRVAGGRGE